MKCHPQRVDQVRVTVQKSEVKDWIWENKARRLLQQITLTNGTKINFARPATVYDGHASGHVEIAG